ncbi:HAD family hydrolase [Methylobacterium sp. E-045]|uniref:HAD family hydrolase n=1 Tax=Methylobacterium sp. E-045 TaxID=2836575 RepID=UPI001FBB4047|nr:HAD family hydrolase [Methylobacterium sp. E-045]MCJ2131970.1 HAD family hydrolase [Methylobacterium sp. E-045]
MTGLRPRRLAGILFDKDGTLIDFDRTWGPAAHAVMDDLAGGDRAQLKSLMQVSHYVEEERRFLPTSPLIAGSSAAYGPLWAAVLGRPAGPDLYGEMDRLFRREGLAHLCPIGDPAGMARDLVEAGYALGIATNDAEASARAQADALGLTPHLTYVAGYDSGHGAKPEPGMVGAFAAHLGVAPGRIAMVGDSPYDLVAGRSAGAVTIAVLSGPLGEAAREVMAPLADHVIGSIKDLAALLDRIAD